MRASKLKHLRSEHSEDAVSWNVFRSLRQIDPTIWLPLLCAAGQPPFLLQASASVTVELWRTFAPPPRLLESGDEGDSEIDIVVQSPSWVWFIEAKYKSDISSGTTTRPSRDQLLRNIDVGSYHAGVRDFYFSLLITSSGNSREGAAKIAEYCDFAVPRSRLAEHRPDGLMNLRGISLLTWADLATVLAGCARLAALAPEKECAQRVVAWLEMKAIVPRTV